MKHHFIASLILLGLFTTATAAASSAVDKKQVDGLVHDYILQNPEVLVQSLQSYQQKQMDQTRKSFDKIQADAPQFANRLFHSASDPVAGNPNGAVTLVEFFDYQCPHCVEMTPVIDHMIQSNDNLRVVFKEFPIRGPMSNAATRAALAAQKQGKYFDMHKALMASKTQPLTDKIIDDIAQSIGLDMTKFKADMKDASIDAQIKADYELAKDMKIMFTPVLFISRTDGKPNTVTFIPGQAPESALTDAVKKAAAAH